MQYRSANARALLLSATVAFGMVLCFPQAARAEDPPTDGFDPATIDRMTASTRQVSLTEDMVERLIRSHAEMRAAAAKYAATQLPDQLPEAGSSDLDVLSAEKRRELEGVAAKHGFKSLEEWSVVASSVAMSYAYAMNGKKPGAVEEAVRLNTAQVERDKRMSEEQKRQIIDEYREIGAKLARIEPLKENFELVMRMKEKITAIMDPDKK